MTAPDSEDHGNPPSTKLREHIKDLRLNRIELRRQVSYLEWFKAGATAVTLLGIAVTFGVGFYQATLTRDEQINERFDKALSRISSANVNDRLMGVSSLRLFLMKDRSDRQEDALYFLINAVNYEQDPKVQQAILDTFSTVPASGIPVAALNRELQFALDSNRTLANLAEELNRSRLMGKAPSREEIFNDFIHYRYARLKQDELRPLEGMSRIVAALVRAGAYSSDFSSVSCVSCDLSHASLAGVHFTGAYLPGANFVFSNLARASFRGAYLGRANFNRSDLQGADLRDTVVELDDSSVPSVELPSLECADLRSANLSGLVLLWLSGEYFLETPRVPDFTIQATSFHNVRVDKTTIISPLAVAVTIPALNPSEDGDYRFPTDFDRSDFVNAAGPFHRRVDELFGFNVDSFLGAGHWEFVPYVDMQQRGFGSTGVITKKQQLFGLRYGGISDSSTATQPFSEAQELLFETLKSGNWIAARLPAAITKAIQSINEPVPGLVQAPGAPNSKSCDDPIQAATYSVDVSSTYVHALGIVKDLAKKYSAVRSAGSGH